VRGKTGPSHVVLSLVREPSERSIHDTDIGEPQKLQLESSGGKSKSDINPGPELPLSKTQPHLWWQSCGQSLQNTVEDLSRRDQICRCQGEALSMADLEVGQQTKVKKLAI